MAKSDTSSATSYQTAWAVEGMVQTSDSQRKQFERRWYDNNFFDDGYHYRYMSRTTGKIVDLSQMGDTFIPHRAIPKASRQIRGVANLLLANEPTPVVYPDKTSFAPTADPALALQAKKKASEIAKRVGNWLENEWKHQHLKEKLIRMVLLAAKHGVSYLEVWPDDKEEEIKTEVYDAFDIYLKGELTSIYDSPYIIKACPKLVSDIKANPNFDEEQLLKITPDNKYASSEIKEAYMQKKYGTTRVSDNAATLILKEAYLKEHLDADNMAKVAKDLGDDFGDRKKGDIVIRQVFECAGVWLSDKYINLPDYPFIDFRFEPGPIYQTPFMERFIPANKSLDSVVSRMERLIGTMTVGAWMKRRGENFKLNNISGGLEIEYDTTPPVQANMAPIPGHVFSFIGLLNSIIEEQGASTSALGNAPPGVKSGVAIESLKASEYANLKIVTDQLKETVRVIAEKMIDIAAAYYISPKTVYNMKDGEPDYFDVIGQKGLDTYEKITNKGMGQMPNAIPIKDDYQVDIQIESGLGFTEEGKKKTMQEIINYMTQLAKEGLINQDAVAVTVKRFLEIFQFGSTQEFMDALEGNNPVGPADNRQIEQVKIGTLEALKDAGEIGPEATEKRIMENKIGLIEALKESGLMKKLQEEIPDNPETAPIPYKDAPEDIKRQMEAKAGLVPSRSVSPAGTDQINKVAALMRPEKAEKEEKE